MSVGPLDSCAAQTPHPERGESNEKVSHHHRNRFHCTRTWSERWVGSSNRWANLLLILERPATSEAMYR